MPETLIKKKKFEIIKNSIEVENFLFDKERRETLRACLGLSDCFVIGHVGRFSRQKNHHFLLDIFSEIYKKDPTSRLLLIGDGILRGEIERIAIDRGLSDKIVFAGLTAKVGDYLSAMDTFVLPSKYEGLGMVLIEAQISGLRCFASKHVIPEEVDVTGLVKFIELNKPAEYWAENILSSKEYTRSSNVQNINNAGYNVHLEAKKIQEWYEAKYNCRIH